MVFLLLFHFSQFILFFAIKKQHFSHSIFFSFPVFFIFVNYITFFFKRNGKVFPLFSHYSSFPETLFHKIAQKSSLLFCTLLIKLRTKLSFYLCMFYTLHNFVPFLYNETARWTGLCFKKDTPWYTAQEVINYGSI